MEENGAVPGPVSRTLIATYGLFLSGYFFLPERSPLYLFYCAAVLLPFLPVAWDTRQDLLRSRLVVASLILTAYLTASALWSPALTPGCLGFLVARGLLTASFLLVSVYLSWRFPAVFDILLKAVTLCAAGFGLVSIVVFYHDNPFPAARMVSFAQIDNSNTMGVVYGLFTVLAMHFLLSANSVSERSAWAVAALALIAVVVFTQSKNAFVATVAGLLALTSWRHGYRNLLVGVLLLAMLAALYETPLAQRFLTDQDLSMGLRLEMWQAALGQIAQAPLVGHGQCGTMQLPAGTTAFSHPHSIYLATAWYGGLCGLLLLLWVLVLAFRQAIAWRTNHQNALFLALVIYVSLAISVDFDSIVTRPREPWLYFWLPLAWLAGATLRHPASHAGAQGHAS